MRNRADSSVSCSSFLRKAKKDGTVLLFRFFSVSFLLIYDGSEFPLKVIKVINALRICFYQKIQIAINNLINPSCFLALIKFSDSFNICYVLRQHRGTLNAKEHGLAHFIKPFAQIRVTVIHVIVQEVFHIRVQYKGAINSCVLSMQPRINDESKVFSARNLISSPYFGTNSSHHSALSISLITSRISHSVCRFFSQSVFPSLHKSFLLYMAISSIFFSFFLIWDKRFTPENHYLSSDMT